MSSTNLLLLEAALLTGFSCVGFERAEVARDEPKRKAAEPHRFEPREIDEIARQIERSQAYLESERDGPLSIATAVLFDRKEENGPALGMAVVEVSAGGLGLRLAAELIEGTHHVFVLPDEVDCSAIDLKRERLSGSPDPDREDYLGAVVNVRKGPARFHRRMPDGVASYRKLVGRPLVLVHAKGASVVCGVFRESDDDREEDAVSRR